MYYEDKQAVLAIIIAVVAWFTGVCLLAGIGLGFVYAILLMVKYIFF